MLIHHTFGGSTIFLHSIWVTFRAAMVLKMHLGVKPETNEQLLLRGLANNDTKAIETIYKDNFKMVQAFILNNNGTYDDARDIFQEAMITLYEKAKSESFVLTSQIKTYIYSVCKRMWLKRLQQMGRYVTGENFEETLP